MKHLFLCACTAALIAASAPAQESSQRPAELQKLEKLIGNWEGQGTHTPYAGAEPMAWTSTSTAQWILGGKFLLEDMRIKFAAGAVAGMPSDSLIFRTLHGWDPERKVLFTHNISNMGMGAPGELHWHDDNTLLAVTHGVEGGVPYVERSLTKLTDGTFQMSRAAGDGEMTVVVEGKLKKGGPGFSATKDGNVAFMPAGPEMTVLTKLAGSYAMAGKVWSAPGTDAKPLTSKVKIESLLGGHAILSHIEPGGGRVESYGHGYWDMNQGCYAYFAATADGRYVPYRAKLVGKDSLVFTAVYTRDGAPAVERLVLGLGADGTPKSLAVDLLSGTAPVARLVEGTYTREGAAAKTVEAKFSEGSCCAKALAAGTKCTHPCCVEATAAGKVCTACNS